MCRNVIFTIITVISIFLIFFSCATRQYPMRPMIDLSGSWQFQMDPENIGIDRHWYAGDFKETILLPGTLDENHKGILNQDTTDMHLNRIYTYTGPVWFRRKIDIPKDWESSHIELIMERTKVSQVWFDSVYIGTDNTIFSEQIYNLTGTASPGRHVITIRINNQPDLVPVAGSHAYSEDTQTNWNGVLGQFCLEASDPVRFKALRVYPDIQNRTIQVRLRIENPYSTIQKTQVLLEAQSYNTPKVHHVPVKAFDIFSVPADTTILINYSIGEPMQLWSEFNPALYRLTVTLKEENHIFDQQTVDFGMREFCAKGKQFTVNDLTIFLRGKHDACVFPLTGYPPMDKKSWIRVFRTARNYGLNHYRFHSWCPPRAAFEAADICGFYLQPELPIWWSFQAHDTNQVAFMMKEGYHIMDSYGNHASFVMFALGNEIWQDRNVLKQMVVDLRAYDNRHLYAQGSNNRGGDPSQAEGDDFWVTFRTAPEQEDCSMDVRSSISFLDSKEGGIINTLPPSTIRTYSTAISRSTIPVVGHEIGQYQTYPDFKTELPKYKGVLQPWNLETFSKRLEARGMMDQNHDFFKASGALSVLCYREDIETALRTPGFAGFQLLDLQDFPGQGTALVGLLDAFMDSKGLISPEEFRQFCNDIVILLSMDKYCWENNEIFSADIRVANYSPKALVDQTIKWRLITEEGNTIRAGEFNRLSVPQGGLTLIGHLKTDLSSIKKAQKVLICLEMEETQIKTDYPAWIYPSESAIRVPDDIVIADDITAEVGDLLRQGSKVLLFPNASRLSSRSVGGQFISEFWNYGMFTSLAEQWNGQKSHGTMGILTDPTHPVFNDFPTEFHTNWQWWSIIKNSSPIILDEAESDYRPIVQIMDNINRNHKLGLIFEYRIGKGKLIVCSADLQTILNQPEAKQLYNSIINYMDSEAFSPKHEISMEMLKKLL